MQPITSRRELGVAKKSLIEIRIQLKRLRHTYCEDKEAYDLATGGLRDLAREIRRLVRSYEMATAGQLPPVVGSRNPRTGRLELPRVLRL